jgi:hypothetical protein
MVAIPHFVSGFQDDPTSQSPDLVLQLAVFVPALLNDYAAIDRRRTNLRSGTAEAEHSTSALVPCALCAAADITFTNDGGVF